MLPKMPTQCGVSSVSFRRHCSESVSDLTVEENKSIYAKLYSVPKAEREKNIQSVLEAVDLVKWRGAQTKTLSGGMRRRLEIARGLVHNP